MSPSPIKPTVALDLRGMRWHAAGGKFALGFAEENPPETAEAQVPDGTRAG